MRARQRRQRPRTADAPARAHGGRRLWSAPFCHRSLAAKVPTAKNASAPGLRERTRLSYPQRRVQLAAMARWGDSVEEESGEGEVEVYEVLPETQVGRKPARAALHALLRPRCRAAGALRPPHAASRPQDHQP